MAEGALKVMVVDDHPMWRDAVARDLAEAAARWSPPRATGREAVRRARAALPEVMVLDLNLPGLPGVQVCKELVGAHPALRVLVLSASGEHEDVLEAVKSGATGYLVKSAGREELLEAVRRTAVGDPVFTPGLAGLVLGEYRRLASDPAPDAPSITNRRGELRSIRDRVLVHQWADAFLAQNGAHELMAHKAAKFLSHDLRLYTPELRTGDDGYRQGFVQFVAPYLRSFTPEAYDLCGPLERVRAFGLMHGRVDVALSVSDYTQRRSVLSSDLVERDEKVYWSGSLLGRPHAERFLDVTDLDLTGQTLSDARLFNQATRAEIRDGELHVTGYIRNQFGRIGPKDKLELTAVLRRRSPKTDHTFAVSGVEVDDEYIRYHTTVDLDETVGESGSGATWNLFVQIRHAGQRATTTVCVRGVDVGQERYRGDGETYEIYETVSGNLALRPETSEQQAGLDPRGTPWLWWADSRAPEPAAPPERYALSLVVHCHNDEYNLYEFLNSLAAQADFTRTQVILVDDGSGDSTPGRLAAFAAHYPNVSVVTQVPMGMRVAFDNGLQYVSAPYVMFARARDILGEDSLGRLLRTARSAKADVVIGDQDNFPGPGAAPTSRGSGTSPRARTRWHASTTPPTSSSPRTWGPSSSGPGCCASSGCAAARDRATRTPGWPCPPSCTRAASRSLPRPPSTSATRNSRTRSSTCPGTTR